MFWDYKQNYVISNIIKLWYLAYLMIYFILNVMTSGWAVARQVLKGSKGDEGGLLDYQTRVNKPWQMILLFNMLSMTPGSLSTDIDEKNQIIKVHLLNMAEKEQFYKVTSKIETLLIKAI